MYQNTVTLTNFEEYTGSETKFYYSELPYIIGTYVREGKEYKKEVKTSMDIDYSIPTVENFTCLLNGKYALDEDTISILSIHIKMIITRKHISNIILRL